MFASPCWISHSEQFQASSACISQRCLVLLVALAHSALNELGQQLHGREIKHHGGRQGDSCGESCRVLRMSIVRIWRFPNMGGTSKSSKLWGSHILRHPHLGMIGSQLCWTCPSHSNQCNPRVRTKPKVGAVVFGSGWKPRR